MTRSMEDNVSDMPALTAYKRDREEEHEEESPGTILEKVNVDFLSIRAEDSGKSSKKLRITLTSCLRLSLFALSAQFWANDSMTSIRQ